jgi:PAP2 superfamily
MLTLAHFQMTRRISSIVLEHGALIGLITIHTLAVFVVYLVTGNEPKSTVIGFFYQLVFLLFPVFVVILGLSRVLWTAAVVRPDKPILWLYRDYRGFLLDGHRLLQGALSLFLISYFFPNFSFLKDQIVVLHPFSWDEALSQLDRFIHFGLEPYSILMSIFGNPTVVSAFNATYHAWLFILMSVTFFVCFSVVYPEKRMTFLLAFVLTWGLGGNMLATLLSSAGPVYYQRLGFGDTFAPLMSHLKDSAAISPVWALDVQEMLWQGYLGLGKMTGISAMPSMHVASTTLLFLYARVWGRFIGFIFSIFLIAIMIGSVLLGWHYAVDGYVGVVVACLSWKLASWLVTLMYPHMSSPKLAIRRSTA